jgi:hypothetical protein
VTGGALAGSFWAQGAALLHAAGDVVLRVLSVLDALLVLRGSGAYLEPVCEVTNTTTVPISMGHHHDLHEQSSKSSAPPAVFEFSCCCYCCCWSARCCCCWCQQHHGCGSHCLSVPPCNTTPAGW